MARLDENIMTKITIGDWSDDGHGSYDDIFFMVNYPIHEIREAYKKSCRTTGVQFNHNTDYTGLGKTYGNIWTDYGEGYIKQEDVEVLKEHGILTKAFITSHQLDVYDEGFVSGFRPESAAELIMTFIAYSMPEDFVWSSVSGPKVEPINGWWNEDLNVQFGYGLYE